MKISKFDPSKITEDDIRLINNSYNDIFKKNLMKYMEKNSYKFPYNFNVDDIYDYYTKYLWDINYSINYMKSLRKNYYNIFDENTWSNIGRNNKTFTVVWNNSQNTSYGPDLNSSLKSFLTFGIPNELYVSKKSNTLLNDDNFIRLMVKLDNIILVDGDNIYEKYANVGRDNELFDIGFADKSSTLRLIQDDKVLILVAYRYDGISPSLAYQQRTNLISNNNSNNIQIVKSYGVDKDAADINLHSMFNQILDQLYVKKIVYGTINISLQKVLDNIKKHESHIWDYRLDMNDDTKKTILNTVIIKNLRLRYKLEKIYGYFEGHENVNANIRYLKILSSELIKYLGTIDFTQYIKSYSQSYTHATGLRIDQHQNMILISNDRFLNELKKYGDDKKYNINIQIIDHAKRDKYSMNWIDPKTLDIPKSVIRVDLDNRAKRSRLDLRRHPGEIPNILNKYAYPFLYDLTSKYNITIDNTYNNLINSMNNYRGTGSYIQSIQETPLIYDYYSLVGLIPQSFNDINNSLFNVRKTIYELLNKYINRHGKTLKIISNNNIRYEHVIDDILYLPNLYIEINRIILSSQVDPKMYLYYRTDNKLDFLTYKIIQIYFNIIDIGIGPGGIDLISFSV